MCGFIGFVGKVDNEEVLENMMNTIVHHRRTAPDSFLMTMRHFGFAD